MQSWFNDKNTLVLQVLPAMNGLGHIQVGNLTSERKAAILFFCGTNCPLLYFQENASFQQAWINNGVFPVPLLGVNEITSAIVTVRVGDAEKVIDLPVAFRTRLLDYFKLDINRNLDQYEGFDCGAFVHFISDIQFYPPDPHFEFMNREIAVGDVIVLTDGTQLPDSIKHWAIYLGGDSYLSKFGQSTAGNSSPVEVMNLTGMMHLYSCTNVLVAIPKKKAPLWDGSPRE